MWIHNHEIQVENYGDAFNIHNLADFHIGAEEFDKRILKFRIEQIMDDPKSMWLFAGDWTDDDRPTTRARKKAIFSDRLNVLTSEARDHCEYLQNKVIPMLWPLTERPCIGTVAGHHWRLIGDMSSAQWICNFLTAKARKTKGRFVVPFLGEMSAWVFLKFKMRRGGSSVKKLIHMQHGMGGSQAVGSALKKLEKAYQSFLGDVYVRAHDCRLESAKIDQLYPKDSPGDPQIMNKPIILINTGSATRAYTETRGEPSYPEASMMKPISMGWAVLHCLVRKARKWEDISQNITIDMRVTI